VGQNTAVRLQLFGQPGGGDIRKSEVRVVARAAVAWPILWSLDTFLLLAQAKNLLDKTQRVKIPKKTIYMTMLLSPFFCLSNTAFTLLVHAKTKKIKTFIPL